MRGGKKVIVEPHRHQGEIECAKLFDALCIEFHIWDRLKFTISRYDQICRIITSRNVPTWNRASFERNCKIYTKKSLI